MASFRASIHVDTDSPTTQAVGLDSVSLIPTSLMTRSPLPESYDHDVSAGPSPTGTLFHYTTATGLLGIVSNAELWATDYAFLNDRQELDFARNRFVRALHALKDPTADPLHPFHGDHTFAGEFESFVRLVVDNLERTSSRVYVTCFCERGDLLSQWRGYGSDHGYSIEFEKRALADGVHTTDEAEIGTDLYWIGYGDEAATATVDDALRDVAAETNLGHPGMVAHHLGLTLLGRLATVKNQSFEQEREWRCVVTTYAPATELRFRPTDIGLVPYVAIPFDLAGIKSVTVGPGRHVESRVAGVRQVLAHYRVAAEVRMSDIPLR